MPVIHGVPCHREIIRKYVNEWIDSLPERFSDNELSLSARADVRDATMPGDNDQRYQATGSKSLVIVFRKNGHWEGADGPPV